MGNLLVLLILAVIFTASITYVVRAKRSGVKCIGCPHGGQKNTKDCHCSDNIVEIK